MPDIESILNLKIIYWGPEDDYVRVQISEDGKSGLIRSDNDVEYLGYELYRNHLSCSYTYESQCSSGLLFRVNYLDLESGFDWFYVGNESEQVSGKITGEEYYDWYNDYEDWTDLNGNTLVIVVQSDSYGGGGGFELEFKCQDQSSIPTCSQIMVHYN